MELIDWVLFLHVLSAFVAVAGLAALWALVLATRPEAPLLSTEAAGRFGALAGPLVGAGLGGALLFGIWLAVDVEAYQVWDGWILASLALWALGGWAGDRAGRAFRSDPVGERAPGIRLQAVTSVALVVILVLMVWKPGA